MFKVNINNLKVKTKIGVGNLERKTEQQIIVLDNLTYASEVNNIPKTYQFEFIWCDISNEKHVNYLFKNH